MYIAEVTKDGLFSVGEMECMVCISYHLDKYQRKIQYSSHVIGFADRDAV